MTKEELKGTAIQAINEGDGKKIIQFYEKHGFVNLAYLDGKSITCDNAAKIFYGLIGDRITCSNSWDKDKALPFSVIKENEYPKVMMVGDNLDHLKPRVVFMEKNGKFFAWSMAKTIEGSLNVTDIILWKYAKEMPKRVVTKEEVANLIGLSTNEFELEL